MSTEEQTEGVVTIGVGHDNDTLEARIMVSFEVPLAEICISIEHARTIANTLLHCISLAEASELVVRLAREALRLNHDQTQELLDALNTCASKHQEVSAA